MDLAEKKAKAIADLEVLIARRLERERQELLVPDPTPGEGQSASTTADKPKRASKPRVKKPPKQSEIYRQQKEEYDRMLERATLMPESKPKRKLPPGVLHIDREKFGPDRLSLSDRAVAGSIRWPWTIWGRVGCGKTYLAADVFDRWDGKKHWYSYSEFCRHSLHLLTNPQLYLSSEGGTREFSSDTWWKRHIGDADLVVIDDIGVGTNSADRNETMFQLLQNRLNRPLILTSNLTPDSTPEGPRSETLFSIFDPRVMSRIHAGTWRHPLEGPDLRATDGE